MTDNVKLDPQTDQADLDQTDLVQPEIDQDAKDAAAAAAEYEHGWSADIDTEFAEKGLNEDTVRFISAKKGEPEWMLDWRLKAFRIWESLEEPDWAKVGYPKIDYQDAYYYAACYICWFIVVLFDCSVSRLSSCIS